MFFFDNYSKTCRLLPRSQRLQRQSGPCGKTLSRYLFANPMKLRMNKVATSKVRSEKKKSRLPSLSSPTLCSGPLIPPHGSSHKRPERLREIRRAGMLTSSLVVMMTMIGSSFATSRSQYVCHPRHHFHVTLLRYVVTLTGCHVVMKF